MARSPGRYGRSHHLAEALKGLQVLQELRHRYGWAFLNRLLYNLLKSIGFLGRPPRRDRRRCVLFSSTGSSNNAAASCNACSNDFRGTAGGAWLPRHPYPRWRGKKHQSQPFDARLARSRHPSVTWQPVRLSLPQREAADTSGSAPDDMRDKTTCRTRRKVQCPPASRGEARRRTPVVVDRQSSWIRREEVPTVGSMDSSPDE
jgi:hypothetical protein